MDYSYIFRFGKIKKHSLENAGFTTVDGINYSVRCFIANNSFYADIVLSIDKQTLTVQLFDVATDEKYILFDMPNAQGAFVASLREEVQKIIDGIKAQCFETNNLKDKYISYLKSNFSAEPDFPWQDTPDYGVFRCKNKKWFALIMKIKYRQLGLTSDEEVWVVNIKADTDAISNLVDHKSIFPAWHMNKKHWITILLTAVTDFEKLCELTKRSYELACP